MIETEAFESAEQTERISFPRLMRLKKTDTVVLFTAHGCGVAVIVDVPGTVLGGYCDAWIMEEFEDVPGLKVTITNS